MRGGIVDGKELISILSFLPSPSLPLSLSHSLSHSLPPPPSQVLSRYSVAVLGTPVQSIVLTEDRQKFAEELASIREPVAPSRAAYSVQEVRRGRDGSVDIQ